MLYTKLEVCMGKNFPRPWVKGLRSKAEGHTQDQEHSFSNTDQPWLVNNLFIFSSGLLFSIIPHMAKKNLHHESYWKKMDLLPRHNQYTSFKDLRFWPVEMLQKNDNYSALK